MNDRIHLLGDADLNFAFQDQATRPTYTTKARFRWGGTVPVDPFPCYTHDMALVERCVENIEAAFPIGCLPTWNVLSHETEGRTNGWCECGGIYEDADKAKAGAPFEPLITLAGKRIPIMPAMTRYLVAHEYGHAVQKWCEHKLGLYDERHDKDTFLKQYAEKRGCEYLKRYGARHWHANIGEIFANDFRIIVAAVETEFWPHPVNHPFKNEGIMAYWREVLMPLAAPQAVPA